MSEVDSTHGERIDSFEQAEGSCALTRRQFIGASGVAAAGIAGAGVMGAISDGAFSVKASSAFADTVPDEGMWVRTTCSPNCTGACGTKAFIHDGQIKMINPAADYPDTQYNPRGCLKGLSINTLVHGPDRLEHPLVKDEVNGGMKEASWNNALDLAAEKLNEVAEKYGADSIAVIWQVQGTGHIQKGSLIRLTNMMGWSAIGCYEMNGDLPMFWPETFGCQSEELESYCWEDSRYTMIFGSNVMVTRLPDAQFLNRSREAGGKIVYFDPNYSPTAEKSDEWIQLAPDTDGAFALALANVIVNEDLYDHDFMANFTDQAILIDVESGKRVRAQDVAGLSAISAPDYRETFVIMVGGNPQALDPEKTGNTPDADLDVDTTISMKDGSSVHVRSAFSLLKERLEEYTPETASEICGVPVETIERIAHECSSIKPMHIIFGGAATQWYHGDLKGRACALIAALTGNIGQLGGGISTYVGQYKTRFNTASWFMPEKLNKKSTCFNYAVTGRTESMTATFPKSGIKAFVIGWGNPFEQHDVDNWLRRAREDGEIECVVVLDFQHTKTVDYSDVAFPCASWYEKLELTTTPLHPYVQIQQRMVDPPGEAQDEIWICKELASRLNPDLEDQWPQFDAEESQEVSEQVCELLLSKGGFTIDQITLDDLRKGPCKLAHANPGEKKIPFWEQIHEGKPFPTLSRPNAIDVTAKFVKSGRIEFYREEDTFLELNEQLPCYKPAFVDTEWAQDPEAKEKYPYAYITRNSLFRVHSTYVNNPFMLELQDEIPKVWMNPEDAEDQGVEAGDIVEVYNSRGKVTGALITDTGMHTGQVIFDQGWWSEYTDDDSYNSLIYPWINPTNEVYYVSSVWAPNMCWNECVCNVRLIKRGGARKEVLS